jgi:hypothetical protein
LALLSFSTATLVVLACACARGATGARQRRFSRMNTQRRYIVIGCTKCCMRKKLTLPVTPSRAPFAAAVYAGASCERRHRQAQHELICYNTARLGACTPLSRLSQVTTSIGTQPSHFGSAVSVWPFAFSVIRCGAATCRCRCRIYHVYRTLAPVRLTSAATSYVA